MGQLIIHANPIQRSELSISWQGYKIYPTTDCAFGRRDTKSSYITCEVTRVYLKTQAILKFGCNLMARDDMLILSPQHGVACITRVMYHLVDGSYWSSACPHGRKLSWSCIYTIFFAGMQSTLLSQCEKKSSRSRLYSGLWLSSIDSRLWLLLLYSRLYLNYI